MECLLPLTAALLSLVSIANAQGTATLSPAAQAAQASSVSGPLDPSFAGFGIEPSNLYSFTGAASPNQLSINLLANLGNYSGAPPHLRIGGNTADNMIYSASYNEWSLQNNPHPQGQGAMPTDLFTFGPTFWKALDRFPFDTPITYGLNLAYDGSDYLSNIVQQAQACLGGLSNVKVVSFEIGNEPDLYLQNGFRTGSWGGQVYTQQWLDRAAAVYWQVLQPAGLPANFFEPTATASTIGTTFEISQLVQDGLEKISNSTGTFIAGWNQHDYFYFVSVSPYQLTLDYMLELSNTEVQFKYWTEQVDQALTSGYPYYLREMASAGPTGLEGISDTFGAALWTLNFFCYAAALNVSSVQMHMTDNSFAAAWQPIDMYGQGPHVRPSYAAFTAMAQLIGSGNGTTQIASVQASGIPSDCADYVRTYAAYTAGQLSAIVLINARTANASDNQKGSLTFHLQLPSAKSQTLYLSTLTADGADSTVGTTWNGISFEQDDGKPTIVDNAQNTVQISSGGSASVQVRDSQAVIANIGYLIGSRQAQFNGTRPSTPSKKSSASTADRTSAAKTAALSGAVTTAVAIATSLTPGQAKATGSAKARAAPAFRKTESPLMVMLAVVVIGLIGLTAIAR
jgi:Glycosyl hydrolase family 79 C-terminal beta domain